MILLTANRSMKGEDSLEQVLREDTFEKQAYEIPSLFP
jgi:hypothetical protein